MTATGPKVIEFNGDPETQVVLPLLKNDLLQVMWDVIHGQNPRLEWEDHFCTGVVVAAKGYPNAYKKGIKLPDITTGTDVFVVHAGTELAADSYQSNGGRVLLVGSKSDVLDQATDHVYQILGTANLSDQLFYRRDIGKVVLVPGNNFLQLFTIQVYNNKRTDLKSVLSL